MKGFKSEAEADRALMCRMTGCPNRWSVDMSHGKVCSFHDDSLARAHGGKPPQGVKSRPGTSTSIPLRDAVPSFAEPVEHDEEAF